MSHDNETIRRLEAETPAAFWDSLLTHPPGWQPPRLTVHDFATEEDQARAEAEPMKHMDMTVTVGPLSLVFGNRNDAMNLKLHFHTAYVWMEYTVDVDHGYPSFKRTNDALRERLRELCVEPFADATNEDVLAILFNEMRTFTHPSWAPYGGCYHLSGMRLDVVGVPDSIGHDDGTTTYTIRERTKC